MAAWITGREFLQSAEARFEQRERERLGLVEDDDAAGEAVEFAAGGRLRGMEGFEKLDVGRDNEAGVPVFGGETRGGGEMGGVGIEIGVVLDDNIGAERGEDFAEDGRVLLDDTGERQDVDDAFEAVADGVIEGEGERGERLAAPGGDGEGEEAG